MLEKQLWEPAGLTQRVPAADNCTEIAIAANKVIAEIKVNLRNFMLPPRCACLQSNGAGSVKPLGRREARGAAEAQVYAQSGFCQGFSPDCDSHTPFATNDNAARCLGRPSFCGHCGKGGSTITAVNSPLRSERTHQAVATMFNSANFLPTEAEQHQTLRTPSIAKSCSADKRSARRLRFASVLISLLPIR